MSDCWVRRSWLAHCAYVAELEAEHATIAARADQQHAWVMIGDDHGVYGVISSPTGQIVPIKGCDPRFSEGEHYARCTEEPEPDEPGDTSG